MRRLALAAVAVLALCVPAAVAQSQHEHHGPIRHGQLCTWHHGKPVLFTVKMAARAGERAWARTSTPSRHDWRVLLFIARCQRNPRANSFVHAMYRGFAKANASRRYWGDPENWPIAKASWFNDGTTACGVDASTYHYGTASRDYPCGTQVDMERGGVRITVTVIDYGPAASTGRMWDLTPDAADALGVTGPGVADVHYRVR